MIYSAFLSSSNLFCAAQVFVAVFWDNWRKFVRRVSGSGNWLGQCPSPICSLTGFTACIQTCAVDQSEQTNPEFLVAHVSFSPLFHFLPLVSGHLSCSEKCERKMDLRKRWGQHTDVSGYANVSWHFEFGLLMRQDSEGKNFLIILGLVSWKKNF